MTQINLYRYGDEWVTSYDVWAKIGSYPASDGDGVYVGNVEIDPSEDVVAYEWDPPYTGDWLFSALSIYRRTPGLFFQLNGT
jgi:hypothetical protein